MNANVGKIKLFWGIQIVQLALSLLWMFLTPSSEPVFLGLFSRERFLLVVGIFILLLLAVLFFLWMQRSPELTNRIQQKLEKGLISNNRLVPFCLILSTTALLVIGLTLLLVSTPLESSAYETWAPSTFPLLHLTVQRLLPLIVLGAAWLLESVIFAVVVFWKEIKQPGFWSWKVVAPALLGIFLVFITLAHWFILIFQIRVFVNLPAWYWAITDKPFSRRDVIYILIAVFFIAAGVWLALSKKKTGLALLLVFLASIWLQMGIDYLDGRSLSSIGDRYFISYHSTYPKLASSNHQTIFKNISQYEENFTGSTFTRTKPPGLMAFYLGLERLINGNPTVQTMSDDLRLQRMRNFIVYAFPVWSALFIFLLFGFTKKCLHLDDADSILACVTLILCPNFVLFSLFTDQAIYPFLFLVGIWMIVGIIQHQSPAGMFLLGIVLYGFTYFAFTMLPLFPVAGFYLLLHWLMDTKKYKIKKQIVLGLLFLLGVVSAYWIFRWVFNYDFFTRFSVSMQVNHNFDFYLRVGQQIPAASETTTTRINQIIGALGLNNLEFATITGAAVYILFILYAIRLVARVIRRKADSSDAILASMFLSFLAVNLGGTAQGEVGRLWLFWVPMVVICAVLELRKWKLKKSTAFWLIGSTQLVTLLLTYHFQDLLLSN